MNKRERKIISYVLMMAFLFFTFFVCASIFHSSQIGSACHLSPLLNCCADTGVLNMINHNIPTILNDAINIHFLSFILVAAYLYLRNQDLTRDYVLRNYFGRQGRHFSFRLLYHLTILFSRGILHPKIY